NGSGADILARTSAAIVLPVPERPVKRTPASSGLKSSLATSTRGSPSVRSQRQVGAPFPSNDSICKRLQDHFDRNCHAGHKTLLRRQDELPEHEQFLNHIRGSR